MPETLALPPVLPAESLPPLPAQPAPAAPLPLAIPPGDRADLALRLQAAVLSQRRAAPAASAFVNQLAAGFGCSRVALGFVRRGYASLAALSHGTNEGLDSDAFETIACAMDEAIDQGLSLWLPAASGAPSAIRLAHGRLQQQGAVATVPLMYLGDAVGAVCFEWQGVPDRLDALVAKLEDIVSLVGPVPYLLHLRETPLRERVWAMLRRGAKAIREPQAARWRYGLFAGVLALSAVLAVPVPYRVGGKARVEGESQRALVAPADGFLRAAHARPGDHVKAGQVLIEMADQDLQLQRRKWTSELSQQESAYATALARSERSTMVIALARAEEARAQLALIDAELARGQIGAPFDGVVIDGDLNQALGAPVERGKVLMMLAPGDRHRVVVDIDERDIAGVRAGQNGTLALSALPWDSLPIKVTRVTPIAKTVDGNNVFEVEAQIAGDAGSIRPGLEGVAKLRVGREPLAWTALHRLADWLRMAAWSWAP
jgi:hypothetical protein